MKQLLTTFVLSLLISMVGTKALAYVQIDGIYYNFSETNAEVTYYSVQPNTNRKAYSGDVTIPESVTYNGTTYSVTSIGASAFSGCSDLTSITIPNSVTRIEPGAFSYCFGLTSVHISDIAAWCKIECGNQGAQPLYYAQHLFINDKEIKDLVIPNSVTSIGISVFYNCTGLTSVTIPNSVTSIGNHAFSGCSGLTSVTIPNSVTSIGDYAFSGCSGLTSIKVESGNTNYDSRDNCNAIIETASNTLMVGCKNTIIPNSVSSIGSSAFYGCSGLTSVTIPKSVTSIDYDAFLGCRLENVLTRSININNYYNYKAFSDRTYQHAMLYIPEGTWREAVYDSDWYLFNNIRETALQVDDLSPSRVYTLIDTETFGYAVYDEARGDVTMAKAFYKIDEQDVNSCWMVIAQGGKKCLYNVGAKKYAAIGADGNITLTDNATPIEVAENENGIVLGAGNSRQWGFVKNNSVTDITGIAPVVSIIGQYADSYYSIDGKRTSSPQKGLNIVRMSNGTMKKVVMK